MKANINCPKIEEGSERIKGQGNQEANVSIRMEQSAVFSSAEG